ncbi:MAG: TRAP transporter large permease [Alphaproteobacteria bacterium]|nr:TRAP transporter large permease [Alphaproteobacteria bacterium]
MGLAVFAISFVVLLVLGMPIGFAFLVPSLLYMVVTETPLVLAAQTMLQQFLKFVLLAIPLFILAGELMNTSGITTRIFNFAHAAFGHIRGGLGHVNIIGSMIFAGMSGSATADAAGLGRVEIRAMIHGGYRPEFAGAITAASSTLGPIIPPSIGLVLYGAIAEVGVDWLFMAGLVPGVVLGAALMAAIYLQVLLGREYCPLTPFPGLAEFGWKLLVAAPAMSVPVVIVGGIITGIFTPTEAAVVAVLLALGLGIIYRELTLPELAGAVMRSVRGTAGIMFILATVACFSWVLTVERVPDLVAESMLSLTDEKWVLVLLILLALLILGLFETSSANLLIVAPILVPIAPQLGFDLVHLGVVLVFGLIIGNVTPPVGISLFIVAEITRRPISAIARATLPYLVAMIAALFVVAYWADMVLWLPRLLGYKGV